MSDDERAAWAEGLLELAEVALADSGLEAAQLPVLRQAVETLVVTDGPWQEALFERDVLGAFRARMFELDRADPSMQALDWGASLDDLLARRLLSLGRVVRARRIMEDSLEDYAGDNLRNANLALTLSQAARLSEDWAEALDALERARALLEDQAATGDDPYWRMVRSRQLRTEAQLELDLGRLDRAWLALTEAGELAARFRAEAPSGWEAIAEDAVNAAAYQRFEFLLLVKREEQVVRELEAAEFSYGAERAHLGMALSLLERDDPDLPRRSEAILEQAVAETTDTRVKLAALFALTHAHLDQGELEAARRRLTEVDTIASGIASTPLQRAFPLALRMRLARLAGDPLDEPIEALEEALDDLLSSWASTPLLPGGVGFMHMKTRADVLSELIRGCAVNGELERGFVNLLKAQAQGTLGRTLEIEAPSLEQVREALVGTGGLIAFNPARAHTDVLALDANGLAYYPAARYRSLARLARDLDFQARGGSNPDAMVAAAEALGRELLPPELVERMAGWTHVYLVGGELFEAPPVELLPFGDGTLGTRKAVAQLPSIPLAVHLTRAQGPVEPLAAADSVVIAGPTPGSGARERWEAAVPLPASLQIETRLSEGLLDPRVLAGDAATIEAFEQLNLDDTRMLHVFAHGGSEPDRDLPQCLVFAPSSDSDGILRNEAIRGLSAPQLVVLAACGSAFGQQRMGEDAANHLGGAFIQAGASTVIQARVPLPAAATLRVVARFQKELLAGASPGEAMRRAREQAEPGDEVTAARLFVLGPSHQPLFPPAPGLPPWVGGAAAACGVVVLAAGGLLALRRART